MKTWLIGALMLAIAATAVPTSADAKRIGGGKSTGVQRNMSERSVPDAPAGKPATPAAGQQAAPAAAAAPGAAPAAAPKRNWMGPLAGLAAGLGIAALLSHFGLGEGFANILMMVLLAAAAFFVIRFLLRRFMPQGGAGMGQPALAGAGAGVGAGGGQAPLRQPMIDERPGAMQRSAEALPATLAAPMASAPVASAAAAAPVTRVFVPAAFDSEGFARTAKMIFIRLQAANDSADLDDLKRFTTPEMFAAIRLDIQERGATPQHTDVLNVTADVLDVANEEDRQVVSVRFQGQIVEEKDGKPSDFNEVWHLVKPNDDSRSWAIAGIEQMN